MSKAGALLNKINERAKAGGTDSAGSILKEMRENGELAPATPPTATPIKDINAIASDEGEIISPLQDALKEKIHEKPDKRKYYSLDRILEYGAHYNMIFGERSNGKTYAALMYALRRYVKTGEQSALLRRWDDDFKGKRGITLFEAIVSNGEISKLTNGQYDGIYYYRKSWYLMNSEAKMYKEPGWHEDTPFAYGFTLTTMEHDKSTAYPNITTVIFDEFIARGGYVQDEFVLFMNTLSTIIRDRDNVKIFMLGNTVNQYCPYFNEMGLKHIKAMSQGDIDLYQYGNSGLKVAVEYTKPNVKGKKSDTYFAFDNPKLKMITTGVWELDIYPHCPCKYTQQHVLFRYYIVFDRQTLECEIVAIDDLMFTFIHRKTTELKDIDHDLIYTTDNSPRPNYRRNIRIPKTDLEKRIADMYKYDKVFYADNEVGDVVYNYLNWCKGSVRGGYSI